MKRKCQRCESRKKDEWEQQEESPVLGMHSRSRLDKGFLAERLPPLQIQSQRGFV